MATENTPLPFGGPKLKGRRLSQMDDTLLQWCARNWKNTDLHEWALVAEGVLAKRKASGESGQGDLEQQANQLLKSHGFGSLTKKEYYRRR
jgi:hypothetical protein